MDFALSDSEDALRTLAARILAERATPERLRELEAGEWFDRELWQTLAKAGLCEVEQPGAEGGLGFFELCLVLEEVGRHVAPVPAVATLALGALPIARFGTPAQRKRWLPAVAAGETVLSAALFEPGGDGSTDLATTATRQGDTFVLDGVKDCVPAATLAARILVPARTAEGVALFLVDPRAAGVTLEAQTATSGEPQARLRLAGARVQGEDTLAEPTRGREVLDWMADHARVALAALQTGVIARALRLTAEYTTQRQQFDRPIATFQAVAQRAADAYIQVEACRLATWQAALRLAAGETAPREVAVAAYWAAEAGHLVLAAAQHLHGGMGFDCDYPLHRHYLWAKQIELQLGGASAELERLGHLLAKGA